MNLMARISLSMRISLSERNRLEEAMVPVEERDTRMAVMTWSKGKLPAERRAGYG